MNESTTQWFLNDLIKKYSTVKILYKIYYKKMKNILKFSLLKTIKNIQHGKYYVKYLDKK